MRSRAVAVLAALAVLAAPVRAAADDAPYGPSPFRGRTLYVDPGSNAARDAAALAATDPASSAALHEIARRPQADWFGDWNPVERVTADVAARMEAQMRPIVRRTGWSRIDDAPPGTVQAATATAATTANAAKPPR